ncbi:MAG TPA: single-stranded DNA-binding protein [Prolixibacteraceae bacterium]|nr:single-stranded DNA-binding protein [Prolixibacteraceae bacterium]
MNALRNSVRLIGHLGDIPKIKQLESGKKIANFSMATNETYLDSNGARKSETTWHKLVAYGTTASIAEKYLQKGSEVAIEGKITNRSYSDKNGETHFVTEVVVNSLLMLDSKNRQQAEPET